jgi:hypothetical protein
MMSSNGGGGYLHGFFEVRGDFPWPLIFLQNFRRTKKV